MSDAFYVYVFPQGESVEPQLHPSTTIFTCNICDFTQLSAESTANQTIGLLNDFWRLFDERIDKYDVFKVSKGKLQNRSLTIIICFTIAQIVKTVLL